MAQMPLRARRAVRVQALLLAILGVVDVLSAWLAHAPERMRLLLAYLPLDVAYHSRMLSVLSGLALVFLAHGVLRRKRRAWQLTCLALAAGTVSHVTKGLDWEEGASNLVMLIWLVAMRRYFTALSDTPSSRRAALYLLVMPLSALAYGVAGFYSLDGQFSRDFTLKASVVETLREFFEFGDPEVQPVTPRGRWFVDSLDVVGSGTLTVCFLLLLRPVVYRQRVDAPQRRKASAIVQRHGRSSLAFFTLLDDKSYLFDDSVDGYVAYKVVGDVAIALGDPVSLEGGGLQLIRGFLSLCLENDWWPVFYQVGPELLDAYADVGLRALKIGEEAIIDLRHFTLEGHAWKDLRNAVNRLTREGLGTSVYEPPLPSDLVRRLKEVSDEWLAHQHGSEKTFSLGRFEEAYVRRSPVMTVEDVSGRIVAFANVIPEYARNEGTIDLMRRRQDAPHGSMDLLFVRLAEYFRGRGYEGFNLGLAPMSGVGADEDAPLPERAVRFVYEHLGRFYSYKGLRQYKAKFHPEWEPRYLVYPGEALLPKVALAVVRAGQTQGLVKFLRR